MSDLVSIELLAQVKRIPADILVGFGLHDIPHGGVRIDYPTPDGGLGRARHRWQITGLTGSTFEDSDRPVRAYWRPENREYAERHGIVFLAEGESTCWTLWHQGFAAVGFPGAENVDCFDHRHLAPATTVVIVAELDDPDTYADGVADFVERVLRRLEASGYSGEVRILDFAPIAEDINALYQMNTKKFRQVLLKLVDGAPQR
ncbi:hypothetical protein ACFVUW_11420 [Streptomyces xiamenensis]|uniref:hypothetical protein n=1 Tax=Streptomyces xiamenensis TaxID=408015 RepID=UPI0036EB00BC